MSTYKIEADGTEYTVHVRHDGSRIVVEHEGKEYSVQPVREATPARTHLVNRRRRQWHSIARPHHLRCGRALQAVTYRPR